MGCVCVNERADKELGDIKMQEISKLYIFVYISLSYHFYL